MNSRTTRLLGVGCTFLVIFLCFAAFWLLPVQAAATRTVTVGGVPQAVAITPDGKYAYVPTGPNGIEDNGTVSVINTATNSVTASLTLQNWPTGVAITPDGQYAYVTDLNSPNNQNGVVSVISTSSNKATATVTVGGNPNHGVAITPDGKYVYVTNIDGAVAVISTATNSVTANITIAPLTDSSTLGLGIVIPGASLPQSVAITPNGEYAYVACGDGAISVINTDTNNVTATIPLGNGDSPNDIAITPDGEYAYVCAGTTAVLVISTATNTVAATISGFGDPNAVAITPNGKYAYVTNGFNNSVSVINTATNAINGTVNVGNDPYGVAVTPNGEYAYVTNQDYAKTNSPAVNWDGTVSVINTATNTVITDSSSSTVPKFSSQLLTLIVLVGAITALSVVIVAMKTLKNSTAHQESKEKNHATESSFFWR